MKIILITFLIIFSFIYFSNIKTFTMHQHEMQFAITIKFNDFREMRYILRQLKKMTDYNFEMLTDHQALCVLFKLNNQQQVDYVINYINYKIEHHLNKYGSF